MANWRVRDWMKSTPLIVSPKETLRRARALLQTGNVSELLVVDGGKLVGTLSERDLWNRCPKGTLVLDEQQTDELLAVLQVGGVMIIHPPTVTPEMSLVEAAKLFVQSGRQGLPVVDHGVPIGLLTPHHVLEAMAALQAMQERDCHQGHFEIRGSAKGVARQHAEPAAIGGHPGVECDFHRKVGDDSVGVHHRPFR